MTHLSYIIISCESFHEGVSPKIKFLIFFLDFFYIYFVLFIISTKYIFFNLKNSFIDYANTYETFLLV